MRKLLLGLTAMLTAVTSMVTVGAPAASGEQEYQPFYAIGIVAERGVGRFQLNPVSETSPGAAPYVTEDGLEIFVRPDTGYYKKTSPDSTRYTRGSYDGSTGAPATVVPGDQVRVSGHRVDSQFVAQYVWNPPPTSPPGGAKPINAACTGELDPNDPLASQFLNTAHGIKNAGFNLSGSVRTKAFLPCTGVGGISGGFRLVDIVDPANVRADVAEAVAAYGGAPSIYTTPATQYYLTVNGQKQTSDYNHVVKQGNAVRAIGRYQKVSYGWLFVARIVWSPPTEASDTLNPSVNINPTETSPGIYDGRNTGGTAFGPPNGLFHAEIVWSPGGVSPTDWTLTGTWTLINNANGDPNGPEVLRGTLDGDTEGLDMTLNLEVSSGEGRWFGSVGAGFFEGTIPPGLPGQHPTAFAGQIRLSVVIPQS